MTASWQTRWLTKLQVAVEDESWEASGPDLSALLRLARRRARLTQEALGVILGVEQSTIARWERGGVPSYDRLPALAVITQESIEEVALACARSLRRRSTEKR